MEDFCGLEKETFEEIEKSLLNIFDSIPVDESLQIEMAHSGLTSPPVLPPELHSVCFFPKAITHHENLAAQHCNKEQSREYIFKDQTIGFARTLSKDIKDSGRNSYEELYSNSSSNCTRESQSDTDASATDVTDLLICVLTSDEENLSSFEDDSENSSELLTHPISKTTLRPSHETIVASDSCGKHDGPSGLQTNATTTGRSLDNKFSFTSFCNKSAMDRDEHTYTGAHLKVHAGRFLCQEYGSLEIQKPQPNSRYDANNNYFGHLIKENDGDNLNTIDNNDNDHDYLILYVDETNFPEDEALSQTEGELLYLVDETSSQTEDEDYSQTGETLHQTDDLGYKATERICLEVDKTINYNSNRSNQPQNTWLQYKPCDKPLVIPKFEAISSILGESEHYQDHKESTYFKSEKLTEEIGECSQKFSSEASSEQKSTDYAENNSFVSDDPIENGDINDPEWNVIKQLTTDEERYKAVKDCWKSVIVPNPHRDLTHHSYRLRRLDNSCDTISRKRKRTASNNPEQILPAKYRRRRTASCTMILDKKIENIRRNFNVEKMQCSLLYEEEMKKINSEYNEGENYLRERYRVEKNKILKYGCIERQHYSMLRLDRWLESERRTLYRHSRCARTHVRGIYGFYKNCSNCRYSSTIRKLRKNREEILKFNQFYCGLHNINPTIIEGQMLEEAERLMKMYQTYEQYYRNSESSIECVP